MSVQSDAEAVISDIGSPTEKNDFWDGLLAYIYGIKASAESPVIANGSITLAMQADVSTGTVFYRKTAGSGHPEVQTLATLKTDLGLTGTNSGDQDLSAYALTANVVPNTRTVNTKALSSNIVLDTDDLSDTAKTHKFVTAADITKLGNLSGTNTGDQTITLTGDVTGSGTGSFAATIGAGKVTLAMLANMATASVFYRKTAGTGSPEVQTLATLKTDLGLTGTNSGDQDLSGLLVKANNLSDLTNAGTARTNLGLNSMATQGAGAVAITGGSISGAVLTSNQINSNTMLGNVFGGSWAGGTANYFGNLGLVVLDNSSSFGLTIKPASNQTADRILSIATGDADRTLTLTGNATISGTHSGTSSGTNSGDQTITLTGDATGSGTGSFAVNVGKINGVSLAGLATGILKNTTSTGVPSIAVAGDFPTLNQSTTGSAATLTTPRAIYGNNFNGSAALSQIITSTYGGTGNGFTKFSGPTTAEKTFTLPDSNATLLYSGGAGGTPSSIVLTNATGLPIATGLSGLVSGRILYSTSTTAVATSGSLGFDGSQLAIAQPASNSALKVASMEIFSTSGAAIGNMYISENSYWDGAALRARATGASGLLALSGGIISGFSAPSVAGGAAQTFTQTWTSRANGYFNVGAGTPAYPFQVTMDGITVAGNFQANSLFWNATGTAKGILLGYDSSSQTGVIASYTASAASALSFYTYNGSAWGERAKFDTSGHFNLIDGINVILGTTTGTKFGTAANQKQSIYGKTPIVQPTTGITGATRVGGAGTTITTLDTFGGYTLSQLFAAAINYGLLA